MTRWGSLLAVLSGVLACGPAYADDIQNQVGGVRASSWIVELGGYGLFEPTYEGSSRYQFAFKPIVDVTAPGDRIWYSFPNDAVTYDLIEGRNYRMGPAASLSLQSRHHSDDIDFSLNKSQIDIQLGAFAEYYPFAFMRTRVELLQATTGGGGFTADFSADYLWKAKPELMITFGPRMRLVDDAYASNYFSTRAAASNGIYVPYKAEGGLHSLGSELTTSYQWTDKFSTKVYFDYNRLYGGAADSPRVDLHGSVDQFIVGIGSSYKFSVAP